MSEMIFICMKTARIALSGEWATLSQFARRVVGRLPLKIQQFTNTNVDSNGLFRTGDVLKSGLNRHIKSEEITVESCYCDISQQEHSLDNQKELHSDQCPMYDFYEIISNFSHNYDPLFIELTKLDGSRIDLVVSNEYDELSEERVMYDDGRPESDIISTELWKIHDGLTAQFPQENRWATNWLCEDGSVYLSFKPDVNYSTGGPNSLKVSIDYTQPKKPNLVKLYTLFTISDIPNRPYTFDLREHFGVDLDNMEPVSNHPIDYSSVDGFDL